MGIAQRITRYRKLNGWSARMLADNTDGIVSRATIANIESGRHTNVSLNQFLAISLALRVPPSALLVDVEQPFAPSDVQFPGSAPRPLDESAPNSAFARWLTGVGGSATTPAAQHIMRVNSAVASYLTALDAVEADIAVNRIRGDGRDESGVHSLNDLREATQALKDVHIEPPA